MIETSEITFMQRWQKIARRIRVPLGFAAALLYLWELVQHKPQLQPIAQIYMQALFISQTTLLIPLYTFT
jgi:hypothetical protein